MSDRIPPLMHSSPKYWANSFDKRWKGLNSSRNYPHRGGSDWYKQSYAEKDKTHYSKTHYHNQNKFRLQNTPRSMFQSGPLDKDKGTKKDEARDPAKLKSTLSSTDKSSEKKQLPKEKSSPNGLRSEGNSSSVQRNKSIEEAKNSLKEIKIVKVSSEHKENFSSSDKSSSDKTSDKSGNDSASSRSSYNGVSSTTKDCDVSMIEIVELKSNNNKGKNRKSRIEKEIQIDDDEDCIITDVEIVSPKKPANTEMQIKIVDVGTSKDAVIEPDTIETIMEVDDSNESTCKIIDDDPGVSIIEPNASESNQDEIQEVSEETNAITIESTVSESVQDNEKNDEISTNGTEEPTKDAVKECSNETVDENCAKEDDNKSTEATEMEVSQDESSQNKAAVDDSTTNPPEDETPTTSTVDEATTTSAVDGTTADEAATVSTAEGANENMDDQSEAHSPRPLVIAEADDANTNDSKSADSKETSPTPSKESDSVPQTEEEEEEAPQEDVDKEASDKEQEKEDDKEQEDKEASSTEQDKENSNTDDVDIEDEEVDSGVPDAESPPPSKESEADISKTKVDSADSASTSSNDTSKTVPTSGIEEDKVEESDESKRAVVHKKRRKKRVIQTSEIISEENGVRQKRRSARNAEEMIRKDILKDDEDEDSSDDYPKKSAPQARGLSPPSLKRTHDDLDTPSDRVSVKRIKHDELKGDKKEVVAGTRNVVRKMAVQDIRNKLRKLTQEELEALVLQKIVESMTINGEMGKLREQARASKRNQEAMRTKIQQLQKQVEGFEMVLKRLSYDKNTNSDKYVAPIKINRSVGLQVNFVNDLGIQSLKQVQALKAGRSTVASPQSQDSVRTIGPKKQLKTRSPRRSFPDILQGQTSTAVSNAQPLTTFNGASAASLVTNKVLEVSNATKRPITLQNANNIVQILPPGQTPAQQAQQAIVVSSQKSATGGCDLVDLTDEEDKSKSKFAFMQTALTITPASGSIAATVNNRQLPRTVFQAVTAGGSVTLSNGNTINNLRLISTNNQTPQTALVNNAKVTYVMQNSPRQLVLTSNNQLRQVTSVQGKNISTIYNKQGVPTINGQPVRVLQSTSSLQMMRHPAPLPIENPAATLHNVSKLAPPAPSLKISKVANGIVLSWNMTLNDKYASIVSYQLYAYQEVAGTAPSPSLWKKVGDVRALPLPMACTLTQFTEGNNYYFAVRAVDEFSRFGQYSKPGNISL